MAKKIGTMNYASLVFTSLNISSPKNIGSQVARDVIHDVYCMVLSIFRE
jgi:hypothetical protein